MLYIGTSGWHYAHWRGPFYPADLSARELLPFYARHLASVEIDNSFYRLPTPETLANWCAATPAGFRFAVKASRYLTHMKKLRDAEAGLAAFLPRVEALADKLGPILFQLPPRWRRDEGRLAGFLDALPREHRYAFELRDPSWHADSVFGLLRRHGVACCIYDLAGFQSPVVQTSDFVYVRLHGPVKPYQGRYGRAGLAAWAERIHGWRGSGADTYVYFDNDEAGFAVRDALELRTLLGT